MHVNGNRGSNVYSSEELAVIRRKEAIASAEIIGAVSISAEIFDGEIVLDLKSRIKIIDILRQADPDI